MRCAICLWLMLLLLLAASGAHADNVHQCRYSSGSNSSVVTFVPPTTISIAANTPIGAMLAPPVQATPAASSTIVCGWYAGKSGNWTNTTETMIYGVVNSRGGYADNVTYETGIPGIGYRIKLSGTYLTSYPAAQTLSVMQQTFNIDTYSLELIKTGPIASGSGLAAGKLADWRWDGPSGSSLTPETFSLGNSITFTTPSCTIVTNPINVILPAALTSAFTGVGATSGTTPFQIKLSCPADTAVAKITMHTAAPDSHPGVIKPAGAGYAAGVGVRVLDGNSNPMVFETQTVVAPPNATTSIPYFAQYFQTAPVVTGGAVKATVTFDIFYQ